MKSLVLLGGALLLKRLTKSTTRWDHARLVARSFSGEKALSLFFFPSSLIIFKKIIFNKIINMGIHFF